MPGFCRRSENCPAPAAGNPSALRHAPLHPPPSSAPHSPLAPLRDLLNHPRPPALLLANQVCSAPQLEPVFAPALLLASLNRFGIRSSFNGVLTDLLIDFTGKFLPSILLILLAFESPLIFLVIENPLGFDLRALFALEKRPPLFLASKLL